MAHPRARRLTALISATLACSGAAFGQPVSQTTGPDIIVGDLPAVTNNSVATVNGVAYDSFAMATTSCNRGNVQVNWYTAGTGFSNDNRHPAICQNIFRLANGQFEQLGQGWLKHGFEALQDNACTGYFSFPCVSSNNGGITLGVGCSDPYDATRNDGAGGMGPKWQVNAATGLFPYPYTNNSLSAAPRMRLSELNAGVASSPRYFAEGQYIVGDDAAANNKNNNASWREVTLTGTAGTSPNFTEYSVSLTSGQAVHREQPAIYAWAAIDSQVQITTIDVPNDGRFILAYKVTGPVGGLYTYEYALHNLNSNRCAGSFTVPLPGAQNALTGIGFHDVEAVGEPNDFPTPTNPSASDWAVTGGSANATTVTWSGPAYSGTQAVYTMDPTTPFHVTAFTAGTGNDHSANVLRWGTLFNYRFQSEIAPGNGSIAVGLWRPGTGTAFTMNVSTPGGAVVGNLTAACCTGLACSVATQVGCGTGTWGLPGTACAPNPCINGACCLPNLTCSQYNTSDCSQQGGAYQGDGTTCAANPCPTGACCNNSTGASATGGGSCPSGSTYMGTGTACGSVTCVVTEYCEAGSGTCGTAQNDERISEVIFNTIDKVVGTGSGPAGCYSDFTSLSTTLTTGHSYPVTVHNAGVYDGDQSAVWVDWNHNLGFLDANEQFILTSSNGGATFTGTVTVPPTALPGNTRMRVRVTYTDGLSPCGDAVYGDVQDFTVVVTQPGVCCRGATCSTAVASAAACTASLVPGQTAGAAFASGSSCNVVGVTATPCCYADYNKTNGINVQDIFDFLSDWFAGSPYSNTAGNGTAQPLTVSNIFSFLNAWFTGC